MINLEFTKTGLKIPSYNDIYEDFISKIKAVMGDDFYLDSESPDNQYLSILAMAQADTCLILQQMINSMYPQTASGINLDRICGFQGIRRFTPTSSTCEIVVRGKPGTEITGMVVSDVNDELWNVEDGTISELGSIILMATSVNPGIYAGIKEIVNIVEAPDDVTSVTNTKPCIQGKRTESDAELRIRRNNSILNSSVGTTESVFSALLNLEGVSNVNVVSNVESSTVENVPANSLCVSILGGDDNEIAKIISNKKSPGCGLAGNVVVNVPKGNYFEVIKFFRPNYVKCKISIILTVLDGYAPSYKEQMADLISNYISGLNIGEPVYVSKIYQLCYSLITQNMLYSIASIKMEVFQNDAFIVVTDKIPISLIDLLVLDENGIDIDDGLDDD